MAKKFVSTLNSERLSTWDLTLFRVMLISLLLCPVKLAWSGEIVYMKHDPIAVILSVDIGNWSDYKGEGIGVDILEDFQSKQPNKLTIKKLNIPETIRSIKLNESQCFFGAGKETFLEFGNEPGIQSVILRIDTWHFISADQNTKITSQFDLINKSLAKKVGQPLFYKNKRIPPDFIPTIKDFDTELEIIKSVETRQVDFGILDEHYVKKTKGLFYNPSHYSFKIARALTCSKKHPHTERIITNFNLYWRKYKSTFSDRLF